MIQRRRISSIYVPGIDWEFFRAVAEILSCPMSSAMRKDNKRAMRHSMAMENAQSPGSPNVLKTKLMAYKSSNMGEKADEHRCLRPAPALIPKHQRWIHVL